MALAAYRHVLRSTRIAFQGDARTFVAARAEARSQFEKNKHLSADSREAEEAVNHAEGVAQILKANVVQGISHGGADEEHYKLRIHDETEKGDNESVKKALAGKTRRKTQTKLTNTSSRGCAG